MRFWRERPCRGLMPFSPRNDILLLIDMSPLEPIFSFLMAFFGVTFVVASGLTSVATPSIVPITNAPFVTTTKVVPLKNTNIVQGILGKLKKIDLKFTREKLAEKKIDIYPGPFESGTVRLGICLIRWEPNAVLPSRAELLNDVNEIDNYYHTISYGKINVTLSQFVEPNSWNKPLPNSPESEYDAMREMCNPLVDRTKIDSLILTPAILARAHGAIDNFRYAQGSMVKNHTLPDVVMGNYDLQRHSSYNLNSNTFMIIGSGFAIHELGHSVFHLKHANAWQCRNVSFSNNHDVCSIIEYGDGLSTMASTDKIELNGWYKYLAGKWTTIKQITHDGEYQIGALEVNSHHQPHVLRVPYPENSLCVEYRKPINLDEFYSVENRRLRGEIGGFPPKGCLLVRTCPMTPIRDDSAGTTNLIDSTPGSQPFIEFKRSEWHNYDMNDTCIHEGENFSNDILGISLSFLKKELPQKDTVAVQMNIDENRVVTRPDLSIKMGQNSLGGNYGCFMRPYKVAVNVYVQNNSEVDIENDFKILIRGLMENGASTTLDRRTVHGLGAGEELLLTFEDVNRFFDVEAGVDTEDRVVESNERNNVEEFNPTCN